ncbi:MAG: nicotinate phosphoribosyltransferase, partial [Deltaproteobacteria bacterium]|nr:nicotinate phosphoribosyltransferase [Deltaproteobacteria bacterium]
PSGAPVRAHHPMYDYMKKTYKPPYSAAEIMVPIFLGGKQVYQSPGLEQIRQRAALEIESLEPEYKRFVNAHIYMVSLSDKVYQTKKSLLNYYQEKNHSNKIGE